jgi:3-deoxy-7-phosphoheptulonate synthase
MGINSQGMASIVKTSGNKDCHVILRGGSGGPNFAWVVYLPTSDVDQLILRRTEHVQKALEAMRKKNPNIHPALMVDCSHGNSSKNHLNQPKVAADLAAQIAGGEDGIVGIMSVLSHCSGGVEADGVCV